MHLKPLLGFKIVFFPAQDRKGREENWLNPLQPYMSRKTRVAIIVWKVASFWKISEYDKRRDSPRTRSNTDLQVPH